MIVLLWFGWYLSGPIAATFDTWDGPLQEFHDIQFNAGGGVALIAAVFCFSILLVKKLQERFLSPFRYVVQGTHLKMALVCPRVLQEATVYSNHSPPLPIRI